MLGTAAVLAYTELTKILVLGEFGSSFLQKVYPSRSLEWNARINAQSASTGLSSYNKLISTIEFCKKKGLMKLITFPVFTQLRCRTLATFSF